MPLSTLPLASDAFLGSVNRSVQPRSRFLTPKPSLCPTLFQERIHGETLRIHIVGDSMVLALRLLGAS